MMFEKLLFYLYFILKPRLKKLCFLGETVQQIVQLLLKLDAWVSFSKDDSSFLIIPLSINRLSNL